MTITRLNPDTMFKSPAFVQAAIVENPKRWIFVGGQNGVDEHGELVGNDLGSQTEQAMKNVIKALAAADATLQDVFKMNIYIVQGQSVEEGYMAAQRVTPPDTEPPTITVVMVAALGRPEVLVEIEAVGAK